MALHLNLLHEEILEQRQRQRDPLKIGMLVLASCGAILFLYYAWNAYQTLEIKSRLSSIDRDWKKIEPQVTAAQKRSGCVAPNAQLTSIEGAVLEDDKGVVVTIEGVAAAREARAAAEDLRQMLIEQLSQSYHDVKVEFKALEDLETIVSIGG